MNQPTPPPRLRTSRRRLALCAVLIATPVILALAVPLYQRVEPTLGGIPFFYWFQMTMAVAAAAGCGASYFIAFRDEPESGDDQ